MASLILTVISIILVAVLTLATLYYGGDAFTEGKAKAQATMLLSQGQQLTVAAELYHRDNGTWPASLAAMMLEGYLRSVPLASTGVSPALAASAWTMPMANAPVFQVAVPATGVDTCRELNKKAYGIDGILSNLYTDPVMQCRGADTSNLQAIVAADPTWLENTDVRLALGTHASQWTARGTPIPAADAGPEVWVVLPGAPAGTLNPIGHPIADN